LLPGIAISLIALFIPALYAKADSINASKQQIPSETANFLAHKSGEKETVVQDTTKVTVWNKKQKVIEELSTMRKGQFLWWTELERITIKCKSLTLKKSIMCRC
jgi:hypothetical protein